MTCETSRASTRLATLLILAAFVAGCTQSDWQEFKSSEGRFVALFPGKPTEVIRTVNTEIGPMELRMYSFTQDQRAFSVAITDYPGDHIAKVGPALALDKARDGAVANTQGKLLSELIIKIDEYPGRQIKISAAGGKGTINARVFLVKNRLYQVLVATPVEDSYSPQVSRFLDSFKLL